MARRSCVSSRGHTAHQTVAAFVTLHTATGQPVCAWKVNTVGCSAAVWTLSLFSSQRSQWKAHCFANRGVAEQAALPLQTPAALLNLQVRTLSCTMVSREQTLSVSTALFCPVCHVKQLQNAAWRMKGRQHDKRRAVMVYRVCFHTCSQTEEWIGCSCLTAQQSFRLLESAALIGWPKGTCPGRYELPGPLSRQLINQVAIERDSGFGVLCMKSQQWQRFKE